MGFVWARLFAVNIPYFKRQGRVVRKVDNAIHRINHYPVDSVVCFVNIYTLDDNVFGCKQLLDEVFVISRIIKVEVRVISRSRRLRLITLTETLIILDITKTESNNCFIIH